MTLHPDELAITAGLVTDLLAEQCPELAGLTVDEVRSTGTVNAVFRVGAEHYVRLPRTLRWVDDLLREWRWLPFLAPQLPLVVPTPVRLGAATPAFPAPWAVYRWIEGRPYGDDRFDAHGDDQRRDACALADFVRALQSVDPSDAPTAGRRPLPELDASTREAVGAAAAEVDARSLLRAWDRALEAPLWTGTAVWIHSDLLRPNLLVRGGRLVAVIDFGGAGVGDPAMDVIAAWSVFGPAGRLVFRERLGVDDGTWERARGVALHQAAVIIPYYRSTNPAFAALAVRTIEQLLADD